MARSLLGETPFEVAETALTLDIPADPDARYMIRPLTTLVAREIGKKHTRHEFNRQTHRREEVVDHASLNDAIMDYVIADWVGVGVDGAAPCTLENKLKLPVAVQKALLEEAQVGDSAEVRDQSFRESPKLVSVLGR